MKQIVLISGGQGSGKTTLANALREELENNHSKEVHIVSFADVIYEIHDQVLAILEKYGFKRDIVKDGPLLQLLGTEWGRNTISDNIWVDVYKGKVSKIFEESANPESVVILTPDCRFRNEFDAYSNSEALKVRLICDKETRKQRCSMWRDRDDHPSERDLDDYAERGLFHQYLWTENTSPKDCVQFLLEDIL